MQGQDVGVHEVVEAGPVAALLQVKVKRQRAQQQAWVDGLRGTGATARGWQRSGEAGWQAKWVRVAGSWESHAGQVQAKNLGEGAALAWPKDAVGA